MLLTLAWRNIWRNRQRSIITMTSIAGAVLLSIATVSLQRGVFDRLIENLVSLYSGYIQVHGKGYWNEQTLENSFELSDSLAAAIEAKPGVQAAAPRLEAFALASAGEKTRGCLVVGIDPGREQALTGLKDKVVDGAYLQHGGSAVLLAEGLAEKLQLRVGDTVVLLSQGYYGSPAAGQYRIEGLLHFGSPELNQRVCYLDLPAAQTWLDAQGRATALALNLKRAGDLQPVKASVQAGLPDSLYEVMTWEEMMPEIIQHIRTDTAGTYIYLGVLYLLISFGIFSTLLMMLAERCREFGVLVALGMRKNLIARMILLETALLTLLGSLAGTLISFPIVWYLHAHPIRLGGETAKIYERFGFEAIFPAALRADIFYNQTLAILLLGLALALYPTLKVLKLEPVKAMAE